jgi:hypothetical protein
MITVGAGLVGPEHARYGPEYQLEVGDGGDGARFQVGAYPAYPHFGDPALTVLICTPHRTCVGVTVAAAITLAAATLGGGQIDECQLRLFPVADPVQATHALRLNDPGTGFVDQCVRFVRAIDALNGWPSAVDLAWSD